MTAILTKQALCQMISTFDRSDLIDMLTRRLNICIDNFDKYTLTGSDSYLCDFDERHLKWLNGLIHALSQTNRTTSLKSFIHNDKTKLKGNLLKKLGFTVDEQKKISSLIKMISLDQICVLQVSEIESIALNCGIISKCRSCQNGHFTTDINSQNLSFHGCLINSAIQRPIQGQCTEYSSRLIENEQD